MHNKHWILRMWYRLRRWYYRDKYVAPIWRDYEEQMNLHRLLCPHKDIHQLPPPSSTAFYQHKRTKELRHLLSEERLVRIFRRLRRSLEIYRELSPTPPSAKSSPNILGPSTKRSGSWIARLAGRLMRFRGTVHPSAYSKSTPSTPTDGPTSGASGTTLM